MHTSAYRIRYVRLHSNETLDQYAKRAHQTITNTPIIHIGAQSGQILTIYVQNLNDSFQLGQIKQISQEQKFYLLESGIIGFMNLKRKYGCFKIDQNIMKTNQNGRLKVWIHRDPVKMVRQYPLPQQPASQLLMVNGIIKVFKNVIPALQESEKCSNLEQLLMYIHKLMPKQSLNYSPKLDQRQIGQKKQIGKFLKQKFQTAQKIRTVRRSQDPTSQMTHFTPIVRKKSVRIQNKQFHTAIDSLFKNHPSSTFRAQINNPHFPPNPKVDQKRFLQQTQHPIKIDKPYPNFLNHKNMSQSQFHLNSQLHFENPQKKAVKKPKLSQALNTQPQIIPGSMIAQETKEDLCEKQRLFQRPKFPHSTQSTFVTLKQTKSFGQMPPFNDFQFPTTIEEQKSSQNKDSSKGRSNVFTSQNDIEAQLDNLFMGDNHKSTDEIKNEKEYYQRQHQFQEILFS